MDPESLRPPGHPPSSDSPSGAQAKQLEILNEIARIANLDVELRPMLQRITDVLAKKFDWQLVAFVVADPERQIFTCQAMTSSVPTSIHVGYSRELGTGVVGEVAATLEPVVVNDVRLHANYVDTTPGVLSEICVPIKHKGELVAVLNIESTRLAAFESQLPLLQTVADQIAGAIATARIHDELKERAQLMEMMSEVSRTALDATNLDDFLGRVAAYVYERFLVEIVSIRLYDEPRQEYYRAADAGATSGTRGSRWPVSQGIIGRCFRLRETQLVLDVSRDPDYVSGHPCVQAELVVPITHRGELLGVFNIESQSPDVFKRANVVAFEAFADQIAGALKLLRTNDELEAARAALAQQKKDVEDANALLARAVENLHEVSTHDALTGIYTRRHFDHVLNIEWRRAARMRSPVSLLLGDIDGFKAYNDVLGHPAGDECLRRVADVIGASVHRAGDVVARYGGEEFAVLLPQTDAESALQIGERIRKGVAALRIHHPASPVGSTITISFGLASSIPDPAERNAAVIVQQADHALYTAKRAGRNAVVLYTPSMEPQGKKYSAPGIDVYFEPRLCIHTGRCVKGAPSVFDPTLKPWIRPSNAAPDELARIVETCPSGALHFVRRDGGAAEEVAEDRVMIARSGPLYVRGDITLQTADGTVIRRDSRMALCRCGLSQNKPFCDNSHLQKEM